MEDASVYEKLKATDDLPSPKGVAMEVLRAIEEVDTSVSDLAGLVEKDPAISARLLRAVNAPVSGVARQITSVRDAASLLGMDAVQGITLAFTLLSDNREGQCERFDYELFWSESLARACAMRHVAVKTATISPDEAFTYGLLAMFGRLGLACAFPQKYDIVLNTVDAGVPLGEAEEAEFGITVVQLTARMLYDWGMKRYLDAISRSTSDDVHRLDAMLRLSCSLARIMIEPSLDLLRTLAENAERLELGPDVVGEMFIEISDDWRELGRDLSVHTRQVASLHEIFQEVQQSS